MGGHFWEDFYGSGRIFLAEFFWWNILREIYWGGFFWEGIFGRIFMGGLLGGFFGRNSAKSYLNIEGIDLFVKILVFVKILYLRKGRKV